MTVQTPSCRGRRGATQNAHSGDGDVFTTNDWVEVELESISTLTTITVPPVT
jgi:hypothetical protein